MTGHEYHHPWSSHFPFDYVFPIFTVSVSSCPPFALQTLPPGVVSATVGPLSLLDGFGGFDDPGREVGPGLLRGGECGWTVFWPGFSTY